MVQVTWTQQALEDLRAASLYIAHDSPRYAVIFSSRIVEATARLAVFPNDIVPELGRPDLRELLVGDYRVIYRLKPNLLAEVIAVSHGMQRLRIPEDEQP